jgi:hypothetical protein
VQTAGFSNPNAGAEGQINGVKNAEAFRARMFAARDGQAGVQAPPAPVSAPFYVSVPSAAHSMQHGVGSPELQQLQEINAGIKQASCSNALFQSFDNAPCSWWLCSNLTLPSLAAIDALLLVGLKLGGRLCKPSSLLQRQRLCWVETSRL